MGRRRSRLALAMDLKPKAFALFERLSRVTRRSPLHLGFFPDIRPYPDRFVHIFQDDRYRMRLASPPYAEVLPELAIDNWDVKLPSFAEADETIIRRFVGIFQDAIVPGHTLTPVDAESLAQLALDESRLANWNFAYPAPILFKRRVAEGLGIVLPPYPHYGHLLLDVLMPIAHALRLGAGGGRKLTIITKAHRIPLINACVSGLRKLGHTVEVMELTPFEHAVVPELLLTRSLCRNVERAYGLHESLPYLRSIFEAAYGPVSVSPSPLVYFSRGHSRLRRLLNEDELRHGLIERGFSVFEAGWGNHPQQIATFTQASVLVGVHGAGLANVAWMQPGAHLVEILPSTFRKTTGLHWAAEHDVGYDFFLASAEGAMQSFSIDCAAFFARLDAIVTRSHLRP